MGKNAGFELWLEFEHWTPEPGDDPEDDFFNMKVTLPSGKAYALNVWTFKFFETKLHATRSADPVAEAKMKAFCEAVEHPVEREYVIPPDLLVSRLDRRLIEEIIGHMLEQWNGQLLPEWECGPPLESEE
ncbi:MAG: hypothetical protein ACM359_15755 [Bacillota bacterium]